MEVYYSMLGSILTLICIVGLGALFVHFYEDILNILKMLFEKIRSM